MKSFIAHIASDLDAFGLSGQCVVVGVSGGRDSMFLLHHLRSLPLQLFVAHVNYGLRGAESDADEMLVREYCHANDLPIEVYRVGPDELSDTSIQTQARSLRYAFFETLRKKHGAAAVAVAHHQDDQLETILFQFLRGGGLASMRGMQRMVRGIWRPLLHMSRDQINDAMAKWPLPYREDASNATDDYARNRLRHKVVPELNATVPQWRGALLHRAGVIHEVETFLDSYVAQDETLWVQLMPDASYRLDMNALMGMAMPQYRLWRWMLQMELPASALETIMRLWQSKTGSTAHLPSWRFWKERNHLRIVAESPTAARERLLLLDELPCEDRLWRIEIADSSEAQDALDSGATVMRLDALRWPLEIRSPRTNDTIQPFGMKGHKRVARLLIEKKVEQYDKQNVRVWAHGDEVYWVEGLVLSELCRAGSDHRVLIIRKK